MELQATGTISWSCDGSSGSYPASPRTKACSTGSGSVSN